MGVDRLLDILYKPQEYQDAINAPLDTITGLSGRVPSYLPKIKQEIANKTAPATKMQERINAKIDPITSKANDIAQKIYDVSSGQFLLNPIKKLFESWGLQEGVTPDYATDGKMTLGRLYSIIRSAQSGPTFTITNNIPQQSSTQYTRNPTFKIYGG